MTADTSHTGMVPSASELLTILRIGNETSMRGAGLSLRRALQGSRYADLRGCFAADDLIPLIRQVPELVDQWMLFSEDKRTDGGWSLHRDGLVGRSSPPAALRFASLEQAVAEYVVRELDFWARL